MKHFSLAAAIALSVALHLQGVLHYALVEHVHCPEHGAVEHGTRAHGHAHADHETTGDTLAVRPAPGAGGEGAHVTCPLAVEPRDAVALTGSTAWSSRARAVATNPLGAVPPTLLAALQLAPKTSPPA